MQGLLVKISVLLSSAVSSLVVGFSAGAEPTLLIDEKCSLVCTRAKIEAMSPQVRTEVSEASRQVLLPISDQKSSSEIALHFLKE
jgi:hypothetical protein